jgi:hypothetical protein
MGNRQLTNHGIAQHAPGAKNASYVASPSVRGNGAYLPLGTGTVCTCSHMASWSSDGIGG